MTSDVQTDSLADELADPALQQGALKRLIEDTGEAVSERALAALALCLGAPSKSVQRRAADAFAALAPRDERVPRILRTVLSGNDLRARWTAAYTLARLGGEQAHHAADGLFAALANDDGDVRWAASGLIVQLGEERREAVVTRLIELAHDASPVARRMALYCLRDLRARGPMVLDAIKSASRAESPHLRLAALAALARFAEQRVEASEIAARCLDADIDPGVRRAAAATLGILGSPSPRVIDALTRAALTANDESLTRAARSALERIGKS